MKFRSGQDGSLALNCRPIPIHVDRKSRKLLWKGCCFLGVLNSMLFCLCIYWESRPRFTMLGALPVVISPELYGRKKVNYVELYVKCECTGLSAGLRWKELSDYLSQIHQDKLNLASASITIKATSRSRCSFRSALGLHST